MLSLLHRYPFRGFQSHSNTFVFCLKNSHIRSASLPSRRHSSSISNGLKKRLEDTEFRNKTGMYYAGAFLMFFLGASYASVPLYRMFCSAVGIGGTTISTTTSTTATSHESTPIGTFPIKINFLSNTSKTLPWSFIPSQPSLEIRPGETALAFYTAHNKTNQPITGIATYNVLPPSVAPYFNKIQCFCFEEQPLGPNETVDMPVFFFIDPAIEEDPVAAQFKDVTLSYTFFKAKDPL